MKEGRDHRNLRLGLLAEWAVGLELGLPMGDLPPSARRAEGQQWRDGGYDLVAPNGVRIDVKGSGPAFPDLMVPVAHEAKLRKRSCPVDAFVKATVELAPFACLVRLRCWEYRTTFLARARRTTTRFPIPTLWLPAGECHELDRLVDVPVATMQAIDVFLARVPDKPWERWLTL